MSTDELEFFSVLFDIDRKILELKKVTSKYVNSSTISIREPSNAKISSLNLL